MMANHNGGADERPEADAGRDEWSTAERTTFALSVIIVLALAAVAVVQHFSRPAAATATIEISVAADQAERRQETYIVPFRITNVGAVGVREVTVRFEVVPAAGGEAVDELSVILPVLPGAGFEAGRLTITDDPATHAITGRVESYLVP